MRKPLNRIAKRKSAGVAKMPAKKPREKERVGIEKWHWSKLRRRVLEMRLKGATIRQIAEDVGRNKSTILAWVNAPEFKEALLERETDIGNATITRRRYAQRILLDQVTDRMFLSLSRFKDAQDAEFQAAKAGRELEGEHLDRNFRKQQHNLATFTTASREFNTMRQHERLDMGQATDNRRVHHTGLTQAAPIMGITIEEFMDKYRDCLPAPKQDQSNGEALILQSRAILQNTDILEEIAVIDAAQMAANNK